jgi:hypothetical protein
MAEVFSTVPVRTDVDGDVVVGIAAGQNVGITGTVAITSGATLDVEVVAALPTGANTIGNVGITGTPAVTISGTPNVVISSALPTGANTIGAVTISGTPSVNATITNASLNVAVTSALPTGANTIGAVTISGTPSVNATIVAALPAGTNTIGKVEVVSTVGTIVQEVVPTSSDVIKGGVTATILNSTAIPNGKKAELRQIIVGAGVAMKYTVRTDNTVTPVNKAQGYIPAGGGTIELNFLNEAIVLLGTAAEENFDVSLLNLDKINDAPATVTFVYSLEP